jgi:hypothetical protein
MAYVQLVTTSFNKQLKELKMLYPRLTNCIECASIPALLTDIDNKLTYLATVQYNNIVFSVNHYIPGEVVGALINYKQILAYKAVNPNYCKPFTIPMIASRVKVLIHK